MLVFALIFKDQKNQYLFLNTYNNFISKSNKAMEVKKYWYPDNCPPRKIASQLGLEFGPRWGLVLGFEDIQTIGPEENCSPRLGLGFGLRLGLGLGGNFSRTFTCAQVYFMFSLPYLTQMHINSLTLVNSHWLKVNILTEDCLEWN